MVQDLWSRQDRFLYLRSGERVMADNPQKERYWVRNHKQQHRTMTRYERNCAENKNVGSCIGCFNIKCFKIRHRNRALSFSRGMKSCPFAVRSTATFFGAKKMEIKRDFSKETFLIAAQTIYTDRDPN